MGSRLPPGARQVNAKRQISIRCAASGFRLRQDRSAPSVNTLPDSIRRIAGHETAPGGRLWSANITGYYRTRCPRSCGRRRFADAAWTLACQGWQRGKPTCMSVITLSSMELRRRCSRNQLGRRAPTHPPGLPAIRSSGRRWRYVRRSREPPGRYVQCRGPISGPAMKEPLRTASLPPFLGPGRQGASGRSRDRGRQGFPKLVQGPQDDCG
jgi:hypothetical protein